MAFSLSPNLSPTGREALKPSFSFFSACMKPPWGLGYEQGGRGEIINDNPKPQLPITNAQCPMPTNYFLTAHSRLFQCDRVFRECALLYTHPQNLLLLVFR
ncbi:hypothetical protein NIES2107_45780 [Nostoc carneum NIES-2107]|nr:hypothetical protein NIES2107_45780 [Nostoc carneum NIES-2107]